jgi:hypothetical protein
MFSFTVLCCGLLLGAWVLDFVFACPRYIAGCYFYSQENRLIDMASF